MKPFVHTLTLPAVILLLLATALHADTFTVSREDDGPGTGTLRWAIEQSNSTVGRDSILFTVTQIHPTTALPAVSDAANVNPDTAVASPTVTIDGTNAPGAGGLLLTADSVTLQNLTIRRFANDGVTVNGGKSYLDHVSSEDNAGDGFVIRGTGNLLTRCSALRNVNGVRFEASNEVYLSTLEGNHLAGLVLTSTARDSRVGNRPQQCIFECLWSPSGPNTISGNRGAGIIVDGAYARLTANTVTSNGSDGIVVRGKNATINDNVISYNAGHGIRLSVKITAQGNIGTCNRGQFLFGDGMTLLPPPRLSLVVEDLLAVTITGTFDGTPKTTYSLDVFSLPMSCDGGAMQSTLLAETDINTDQYGHAAFRFARYRYLATNNPPTERVAAVASPYAAPWLYEGGVSSQSAAIDATPNRDPRIDLSATIQGPAQIVAGVPAIYDTYVTNNGPAAIDEVELSIPYFSGPGWSSTGTCYLGGLHLCDLNALASGETTVVHHQLTFSTAGVYLYSVIASAFTTAVTDPNPSNNTSTLSITVTAPKQKRP
jgi:hypothetical protein